MSSARSTFGGTDVRLSTGAMPTGSRTAIFAALAAALKARGRVLRFAMNAGMFESDLSPVGLYVEDGKRRHGADLRRGRHQFPLEAERRVLDRRTRPPASSKRPAISPIPPRRAVRHPVRPDAGGSMAASIRKSTRPAPSEKIRNGVCVRDGANVEFAISEEPVTFHAFGTPLQGRARLRQRAVPRRLDLLALRAGTESRRRTRSARPDRRRHRAGAARDAVGGEWLGRKGSGASRTSQCENSNSSSLSTPARSRPPVPARAA